MTPITKKVLFGTKQEVNLMPLKGYEVESVEVYNKTTNELVESQLTKTCDNPPQWTCSFIQPAGVVAIRPKMVPIYYSVIIEECEFCNIVLVESNGVVDMKVAAVNNADMPELKTGKEPDDGEQSPEPEAKPEGQEAPPTEEGPGEVSEQTEDGVAVSNEASDLQPETEQESPVNFNEPQHSGNEPTDEADVEENTKDNNADVPQDAVYDPGEFADELEDVEPVVISQAEYDKKCASYWQHLDAMRAGQITQEEFEKVKKKHSEFMDGVSTGTIVIQG